MNEYLPTYMKVAIKAVQQHAATQLEHKGWQDIATWTEKRIALTLAEYKVRDKYAALRLMTNIANSITN